MFETLRKLASILMATILTAASATPALPTNTLATQAIADAITATSQDATREAEASAARAAAIAQATSVTAPVAVTRATGRTAIVRATAYNSFASQTDSTPFITATGTRVRNGVVALSRDLLRQFPYGTRITIQDLSGRYNFSGRVFIVEDTMAARKVNSLDIWMPSRSQALQFGARNVRITALR